MQTTLAGDDLKRAWGSYLGAVPWAHFATLTFRIESSPDYAVREFKRCVRRIEKEAGRPSYWFYGSEYGSRLGRLHMHALIGNTDRLSHGQLTEAWQSGFSKWLDYDPAKSASYYVAKYITKDLADYDISANFPAALARHGLQPVLGFDRGDTAPPTVQQLEAAGQRYKPDRPRKRAAH